MKAGRNRSVRAKANLAHCNIQPQAVLARAALLWADQKKSRPQEVCQSVLSRQSVPFVRHFVVEPVQVNVTEQRTDNASLRCSVWNSEFLSAFHISDFGHLSDFLTYDLENNGERLLILRYILLC